jgi:hypothetical protein
MSGVPRNSKTLTLTKGEILLNLVTFKFLPAKKLAETIQRLAWGQDLLQMHQEDQEGIVHLKNLASPQYLTL